MTKEQLIYLSRQYSNMFGFPVRLYENNERIFHQNLLTLEMDIAQLCFDEIIKLKDQVSYYMMGEQLFFGVVSCPPYRFISGPVSEIELSTAEIRELMKKMNVEGVNVDKFIKEMKALSGIQPDTLIQSLIFINFALNGTMIDITDVRINREEQKVISHELKEKEYNVQENAGFFDNKGRVIAIERDIVTKIINGDVQGLIDGANKVPSISSGNLAPKLIRHYKNFFIRLEVIASRAAMQAGLDAEELLDVEELYISKCEKLDNIDRIKNLQYHMIIDYADRVAKEKHLNGQSATRLVNEVSKYIRTHLSDAIKITDISNYLGKSRGWLTTEFKKQTGVNLSEYIKLKKIQQAKELLYETDKSLIDISIHLGFSSQSHFCRVFKEITGMTPLEYRGKNFF